MKSKLQLYKLVIVLLLIFSGFTLVNQVFASTENTPAMEKTVVVEPGDTLWNIARQYKPSDMRTVVYIEAIKKSNHLNQTDLQAGEVLTVPVFE